jgi:hypothetical protein
MLGLWSGFCESSPYHPGNLETLSSRIFPEPWNCELRPLSRQAFLQGDSVLRSRSQRCHAQNPARCRLRQWRFSALHGRPRLASPGRREEDNNRNIHKVAPANWLKFVLQTRLRRKNFTFIDIPLTSRQFRKAHQLQRGIHAALKYTAYSPLSVIDRMLRPFIGSAQMLRGTYGNTTYVARNP